MTSMEAERQQSHSLINGSSHNPIVIHDSESPPPLAQANFHIVHPTGVSLLTMPAATRNATKSGRVKKAALAKTPKPKPAKLEKQCLICTETKQVGNSAGRGFKITEGSCEHFQAICNVCIAKMVKEKTVNHKLDEAALVCPFPKCEYALAYHDVRSLIYKALRDSYDAALFTHYLRNSEFTVSCLNASCGLYFSIEDCRGKNGKAGTSGRGYKMTCPHCEFDMCMSCMHPYHGPHSCSKAEEKENLKTMKEIGAKPCPKCGVNIEKNGGCNHMKCRRCQHDFCFDCLVTYAPNMKHAEGCIETRVRIMDDPRNWEHPAGMALHPGWHLQDMARAFEGIPMHHFAPPHHLGPRVPPVAPAPAPAPAAAGLAAAPQPGSGQHPFHGLVQGIQNLQGFFANVGQGHAINPNNGGNNNNNHGNANRNGNGRNGANGNAAPQRG